MRIRKNGEVIETQLPVDQLTVADLRPGDIFSYLRAKNEHNLYIAGQNGQNFFLNGNRIFNDLGGGRFSPVRIYPEAEIDLGETVWETRSDVPDRSEPLPVYDPNDDDPYKDIDY